MCAHTLANKHDLMDVIVVNARHSTEIVTFMLEIKCCCCIAKLDVYLWIILPDINQVFNFLNLFNN
ncbi:CLUMA_CG000603, isoform A [Clunio marinus]|uniref:CLUMA_CG000603, isoform A n=1 Tax=Clunio marinus TaxID=568069 RepID=A0A1J1HFY3_9DIPT|nr:CLUMA_CG000603, isoform A [Clunio marinus]